MLGTGLRHCGTTWAMPRPASAKRWRWSAAERKVCFFGTGVSCDDLCAVLPGGDNGEALCKGYNAAFDFFGKVSQSIYVRQHDTGG
jgi:hypothetical protein